MNPSVTIAVSDKIKSGPWIYWNDLDKNLAKAKKLGFAAVELFSTKRDTNFQKELERALLNNSLSLSAVGTGAGKALFGLTLCNNDTSVSKKAIEFIKEIITFGAYFNAPAIIGSMQGFVGKRKREDCIKRLSEGLQELSEFAAMYKIPLIYEPLNRYETDIHNTVKEVAGFIENYKLDNILILADLFHMNIEEESIAQAFYNYGHKIGHIHFADSNRKPMSFGHLEMNEIAWSIKSISYDKYISAEAFPYPDSDNAAKKTIRAYNYYFKSL